MPISALPDSPMPFTTQPITAILISLSISLVASSTFFARPIRSILVLPQVGQETILTPPLLPIAFKISFAAYISFTGSSVSETLIVSPMPSHRSEPIPIDDFIRPILSVPASVTPRCRG